MARAIARRVVMKESAKCCRARWLMADRASWLMDIRLGGALSAASLMAQIGNAPAG